MTEVVPTPETPSLQFDTPTTSDSTSGATSTEPSPIKAPAPKTPRSAMLVSWDEKPTSLRCNARDAALWHEFVQAALMTDASFPADLSPYYTAFCKVLHADREGELVPIDILYQLEPIFRLCRKPGHTPLDILKKLCTVTSRKQFEQFIAAEQMVKQPLLIAFLRGFIRDLPTFGTAAPSQADFYWHFGNAIYKAVMEAMQNHDRDAPVSVFTERLQRRSRKCLHIIQTLQTTTPK